MREALYIDYVKTRFGTFQLSSSERGLAQIHFPRQFVYKKEKRPVPRSSKKALSAAKCFFKSYFSGHTAESIKVPIDWKSLTAFEARVLKTLRTIPHSSVTTYSDLAKKSGCKKAARAVGNALGRNPLPVLVPCHRVVRKDQSLGGFSGGLGWKRKLLDLEKPV